MGVKRLAYSFLRLCFLDRIGAMLAIFHSWGNLSSFRQLSKIIERGLQIEFSHSFIPTDTKMSQRRRKSVLILVSKTSLIGLKWKSRWPFFKTPSRRLPGDVLKMSSRTRPQDIFRETFLRRLPGHVLKISSTSRPQDLVRTS